MSSEEVLIYKDREVPRMPAVQTEVNHSQCSCHHCLDLLQERNDSGVLWSPKNELAYIVCDENGYTRSPKQRATRYDVSKPNHEFDEFAGGEPFLSILDRRRLTKKTEDDIECKWKPIMKPDIEIVRGHVCDLVSKLKKQFSHEKQTRKQHTVNAADNAKLVWNNSVDAFLRHHEKPKIDTQYSESSDQPVEGLFTFAVRPSRIKNRVTRRQTHVCTIPQNVKEETKTSYVKVSVNKTEVDVNEEVTNNNIVIHNKEVLDTAVLSTLRGTMDGGVNGHVISSCYRAPMLLDTFYNHTVTMLNKLNALKSIHGHVVHQNFETSQLDRGNEKSFLPIHTGHRHAEVHENVVSPMYKSNRYDEIDHKLISGAYEFQTTKERKDRFVPPIEEKATLVDIFGHAVPPVFNVITQENIYITALPHFCAHSTPSTCGQPTYELYGHSVPPLYSLAPFYSVPPNYDILKEVDFYDRALSIFQNTASRAATAVKINDDFPDHIFIKKSRSRVATLFEERIVQTDEVLTFVDVISHDELFATLVSYRQEKFPTKELPTTPSDEVLKDVFTPSRKDMLCNKSITNADLFNQGQPPSGETHGTPAFNGGPITAEDRRLSGPPQNHNTCTDNHSTCTDMIVDEFDDDSQFGIMSVYCRSGLHSLRCTVSEAER